ncbi:MAG: 1-acyl-sn-glycerol-3-phosphate acyltransferase [Candidatus Sericytochromatia bacterium]|nr:1-acyl-sn-glycerol-3-phosphate acyltransferase [Candidatus Sericytochromatia bacterium]
MTSLCVLEAEGVACLPARGPGLLVANHRSPLDVLWLRLSCPRPLHVVTASWLRVFGLGLWGPALGLHPLPWGADRQDLVALVRPLWAKGELVLVFPEGMAGVLYPAPPGMVGRCRGGAGALVREARRLGLGLVVVAAYVQAERLWCGLALPPVRITYRRIGAVAYGTGYQADRQVTDHMRRAILACARIAVA